MANFSISVAYHPSQMVVPIVWDGFSWGFTRYLNELILQPPAVFLSFIFPLKSFAVTNSSLLASTDPFIKLSVISSSESLDSF